MLLVDEEMISLQHVHLAVACCLGAPGFEFMAWSFFILQATGPEGKARTLEFFALE